MRERLKEPRKGSEIDPEIVCVQGVGAPHATVSPVCRYAAGKKQLNDDTRGDGVLFVERSSELFAAASLRHLSEA